MIEKNNIQKVFELFLDNPSREFHLREMSRMLRISMPTIITATDKLAKDKLIIKEKGKVITKVFANRENNNFINYKRVYNLKKIYDSKLIKHISDIYNYPKNITLFGSYSRGDDIESSDIDIAVITSKKINPDLEEYERYLKRNISIHEIDLNTITKEFQASLFNGIVMEGSW
jgi:predicted nucleotidyltransferase